MVRHCVLGRLRPLALFALLALVSVPASAHMDRFRGGAPGAAEPPVDRTESREILLITIGSGSSYVHFQMRSTGDLVTGLMPNGGPGTVPSLYIDSDRPQDVVRGMIALAEESDCAVRAEADGRSAVLVCHGGRSNMVDIVAEIVRLAYVEEAGP